MKQNITAIMPDKQILKKSLSYALQGIYLSSYQRRILKSHGRILYICLFGQTMDQPEQPLRNFEP